VNGGIIIEIIIFFIPVYYSDENLTSQIIFLLQSRVWHLWQVLEALNYPVKILNSD